MKPESYDRAGFIKLAKDAANSRKRFMSRNTDTKMLLEAFLDAIMVMKLKGFAQLKYIQRKYGRPLRKSSMIS